MIVRLKSMKLSKINCIRVVRDAIPSLDLMLAKALVESLPQDVKIADTWYSDVCEAFEVATPDSADAERLHAAWKALTADRQTMLLGYLDSQHMLREG
jgi:hypothetical protein